MTDQEMTGGQSSRDNAADAMAKLLDECAKQFSFYEKNHLAKNPPDTDKATTNHRFAVKCYEAITDWEILK